MKALAYLYDGTGDEELIYVECAWCEDKLVRLHDGATAALCLDCTKLRVASVEKAFRDATEAP